MTYSLFSQPLIDPVILAANASVRITPSPGGFVVSSGGQPSAPAFDPFPIPRLCGRWFEGAARLLRTVWRRRLRSAGWLLYLDPDEHRWEAFLPPELLREEPELVRAACPKDAEARFPTAQMISCGCLTATPVTDLALLSALTPKCDGLFLSWHPTGWLDTTVLLRAAGRVQALRLADVLTDDPHCEDGHPDAGLIRAEG